MNNMMRCPPCKGLKKVAKLGGMIYDCDTCEGTGKILIKDKPALPKYEAAPCHGDIIKQVADCIPVSVIDHEYVDEEKAQPIKPTKEPMKAELRKVSEAIETVQTEPESKPIKVDGKRAIYKRKK